MSFTKSHSKIKMYIKIYYILYTNGNKRTTNKMR